jgi:hypothetical protein
MRRAENETISAEPEEWGTVTHMVTGSPHASPRAAYLTARRSDRPSICVQVLRGCPIECDEPFTRFLFACRRYINNEISGMWDVLAKILHIVDKRSNFNLHAFSSWLLYFSLLFKYNLAIISVLEFMVAINVYVQPTREKIKFYPTASKLDFAHF